MPEMHTRPDRNATASDQVRWGINVPLCYTAFYTIYAVKCMLTPDVPNNAGTFGAIRVTAPPGSIMNALPPAPVAGRHIIGNFQPLVLYRALAEVLPRGSDGHWPEHPEEIGPGATLRLESIAVAFPLHEAYAQTHLA